MKVTPIGSNKTQVSLADGTEVLFSYSTPVAALVPGKGWMRTEHKWSSYSTPVAALVPGKGWMRTEHKWSATTTRHINSWLAENASTYAEVQVVPQWDLDQLVAF